MRTAFAKFGMILPLAAALAACATTSTTKAPTAPVATAAATTQGHVDVSQRPPGDADGYRPPLKVGVLLPLSGNLAVAAAPVRDGFMAGYYNERRRRPEIRFYDSSAGANVAYGKALADGADYVVGPLSREGVSELFAKSPLKVPVLALNQSDAKTPAGSLSFALSPEDEAEAIAQVQLSSGIRKAIVIAGADATQKRAASAFQGYFNDHGGKAAAAIVYTGGDGFATDVQKAAQTLGGIDGVFIALKGDQIAAMAPKLAATPAANARRFASSQILLGIGKGDDSALDGIVFPTEAWNVRKTALAPAASSLATLSPTARGAASRLFAFGYDAWLITAYPEHLNSGREGGVHGATGDLHVDRDGNIARVPGWSVFRQGQPVPLAER
ncbi:penicillin-binding protein activator [Solilutibacter silvestris]|uniref:LppC putative lipoprotein n=1 Tax=Solilutibacter silvestris TaxID=1645665 RepID=A0A2K1Q2R9_9GAMM|nr:penicillin-binding protein activator [Lysobacter silvestris]PNS09271.1 LppC putative lipoprotein [Lysobacter silvestris]